MLKRISKSFYSMSTGWAALTGLAVFVTFMIVVLPQQAQKAEAYSGGTSPDTSYIYSAGDLYQMAEDYGAEGRAAYIYARFTFDLVFPLVYGFFLTATISWLLARGLVEKLMAETKLQMADVNSPAWVACMSPGKWKTDANGGTCKSTAWTGCSPETGASVCGALK